MLGTLKRIASKLQSVIRKPKAAYLVPKARIPLPSRAAAFLALRDAYGARASRLRAILGINDSHYPFRSCRTKIKGRRDASKKGRSNRRKSARKAKASR